MSSPACWLAAFGLAALAGNTPAAAVVSASSAAVRHPVSSPVPSGASATGGAAGAVAPAASDTAALASEVRAAETAFAKSMADRDHAAFTSHLADETIFLGRAVLRGKAAVAEAWKRFYEGPSAPFSWQPEKVEVLDSGTLGLSSGPVFDPEGKRVGTFNSIWRREADGRWRIIFDNGCPPCDCGGKSGTD